eukprot:463409_1
MGNTHNENPNMNTISSDDNNTPYPILYYPLQQQRTTNQYIQTQQPPQYQFVNSNQSHQQNNHQYDTNGYATVRPITQTTTPELTTSNTIQSNLSPHQLQIQLNQQMQQLRLLQHARQLERQRLHLERQQRNLETQSAALLRNENTSPLQRQHEIIPMQQQQVERIVDNTDKKYPVTFHWSHGGRDVYVVYSGDNWSHKYRMHRSHNDFNLIMEIQPGVYHYRFVVDNQWR